MIVFIIYALIGLILLVLPAGFITVFGYVFFSGVPVVIFLVLWAAGLMYGYRRYINDPKSLKLMQPILGSLVVLPAVLTFDIFISCGLSSRLNQIILCSSGGINELSSSTFDLIAFFRRVIILIIVVLIGWGFGNFQDKIIKSYCDGYTLNEKQSLEQYRYHRYKITIFKNLLIGIIIGIIIFELGTVFN